MAITDGRSPTKGEFVNVVVTVGVGSLLAYFTGGTSLWLPTLIAFVAGAAGTLAGNPKVIDIKKEF